MFKSILIAGGVAAVAYSAGRRSAPAATPVQLQLTDCEDTPGFRPKNAAQAVIDFCDICPRLLPVAQPISEGRIPPLNSIVGAFRDVQ